MKKTLTLSFALISILSIAQKLETLPNKKPIWVFYPDQPGSYPAIISLHGLGYQGKDINKVLEEGLPKELKDGLKIPFIVFAAQDNNGWWTETSETPSIVDFVKSHPQVDASRIYMTGFSSGGDGVLRYMKSGRDDIAAFVICSINSNQYIDLIPTMKGRPVRYFHGNKDVSPNKIITSERFVRAYSKAFGNIHRTVFANLEHNVWNAVYGSEFNEPQIVIDNDVAFSGFDQTIYDWMLQFSLNATR